MLAKARACSIPVPLNCFRSSASSRLTRVIESSFPLVDGASAAPYSETRLHPTESCTP